MLKCAPTLHKKKNNSSNRPTSKNIKHDAGWVGNYTGSRLNDGGIIQKTVKHSFLGLGSSLALKHIVQDGTYSRLNKPKFGSCHCLASRDQRRKKINNNRLSVRCKQPDPDRARQWYSGKVPWRRPNQLFVRLLGSWSWWSVVSSRLLEPRERQTLGSRANVNSK